MGFWYYRACKKFTKVGKKKHWFYCIVEYFPKVPLSRIGKKDRSAWSYHPEWPSGDSKKELIQCLEMMLTDLKYHRTLVEKRPYDERKNK